MSLKLNEVLLYDQVVFPAFVETSKSIYFSIDNLRTTTRPSTSSQLLSPFELTLELCPIRTVHVRERVSVLVFGGILVSVALLLYYLVDYIYTMVKTTQGNSALQALLWGLY